MIFGVDRVASREHAPLTACGLSPSNKVAKYNNSTTLEKELEHVQRSTKMEMNMNLKMNYMKMRMNLKMKLKLR